MAQEGGHVISTDEKTGIQALERAAPTLPMQPGLVERPEYEYLRHGTQCLIANFDADKNFKRYFATATLTT